jgi:hypothetical protein
MKSTKGLLFLVVMVIFSLSVYVACGDDDDDDGGDNDDDDDNDDDNDDDGGGDWYDDDNSAGENCMAFYEMYYGCYDIPLDPSAFEAACGSFDDWADDECIEDAVDDIWECLSDLSCAGYSDFAGFSNEVSECFKDLADKVMDCLGDDDDDDDTYYDDDDDDTYNGNAPVLSNAYWNPNPIPSGNPASNLVWDVCDEEDDLSGGQIFIYYTGTSDSFILTPVYWNDFIGGAPSAPDCGAPVEVSVGVNFTGAPSGSYCVDLVATDGSGNYSNKLTNKCVTMP